MTYQLTLEHAKLWLPVVRELREYYEGKNNKFIDECPLCRIAIICEQKDIYCDRCIYPNLHIECRCCFCLWMIFEKKTCGGKRTNNLRITRPSTWCKQSIKRLKRWEKELGKIIKDAKK